MRVGTFCYATSRGLGHLAKAFHDNGVITDPLVVVHPRVPTNDGWYPGAPRTRLRSLDEGLLRDFVRGKDAMLFFETPFYWPIIDYCRGIGVRTYLCVMHECTPKDHPRPHKYLCPSLLDMQYFPSGTFLPLPVEYPWRRRGVAQTYAHNGGYLGLRGREGTTILIEAMRHVRSPLKLIIRVQENVDAAHQKMMAKDSRIDYRPGTVPYAELYDEGEVCVQPQKFNGCSLPLQEAFAAGMLVMASDRFPMNTWLPCGPLISVAAYQRVSIGGAFLEFDEAMVDPEDVAAAMDGWFGKDIGAYSDLGRQWAAENSWESLKPKWLHALSS